MSYTFDQLVALWTQAGGNVQAAPMAAAVALAESSGNPDSSGTNSDGSVDRGLWQINSVHGGLSTFDPLANARAAVQISNNGTTWRPWCSAWSNNACGGTFLGAGAHALKYLPAGASTGLTPGGSPQASVSTPSAAGATFNAGLSLDPSSWASAILNPIFKSVWYGGMSTIGVIMMVLGIWFLIQESRTAGLVRNLVLSRVGAGGATAEQSSPEGAYEGRHRDG